MLQSRCTTALHPAPGLLASWQLNKTPNPHLPPPPRSYPYVTVVARSDGSYLCAGTLIHPRCGGKWFKAMQGEGREGLGGCW